MLHTASSPTSAPATFPPPSAEPQAGQEAALCFCGRAAALAPARRGTVPLLRQSRVRAARLSARAAAHGAAAGTRAAADRRRRRHRQDHRGRAHRRELFDRGEIERLRCSARRTWSSSGCGELDGRFHISADRRDREQRGAAGARAADQRVDLLRLPVHRRQPRLHQERAAPARLPARLSGHS